MYHTGKMLRKYRPPRDDDQQPNLPTPTPQEPRTSSTLFRLKPVPLSLRTHKSSRSATTIPIINVSKSSHTPPDLVRPSGLPWNISRSPASSGSSRTATSKSSAPSLATPPTPISPVTPGGGSPANAPDEPPPWDRSVDVIWRRRILTQDTIERDDELAFEGNSARLAAQSASSPPPSPALGQSTPSWYARGYRDASGKANAPYFGLPDRVRFLVTKYVLAELDTGKAIRLNSAAFLDPVWPVNHHAGRGAGGGRMWSTEYFDSLDKVLIMLRSYTSVSFAMRVDVLATLFLTRRFHVVYSPFVTELTQPAAVLYMERFGAFMKWITLEVDLSRLGGNSHPSAGKMDMGRNMERVRKLVEGFSEHQLRSRGFTRIQSLVVLVRRYYGNRPDGENVTRGLGIVGLSEDDDDVAIRFDDDASEDSVPPPGEDAFHPTTKARAASPSPPAPIPYCSDDHLSVLDPLLRLEGLVDGLCIVGTDKAYAHKLIRALWGRDLPLDIAVKIAKHCHYRTPSCAYPFTPGQRSVVDYGPPRGLRVVRHVSDPRKWRGLYGCELSQDVHVTEVARGGGLAPLYKLTTAKGGGGTPVATTLRSRSASPSKTATSPSSRIPVMKRKSFSGNPFSGRPHLGSASAPSSERGSTEEQERLSPTQFLAVGPGEMKENCGGGGKENAAAAAYRKGHWKKLSRGLSFGGRKPRPCYEPGRG